MNDALRRDGNEWFGIVFGLMFFKGILGSLAGPAPNYDMQRVLATRNPREACMMNGMVCCVLYFPRYMMITGITLLAIAFCLPELRAMEKPDFEKLLPIVLSKSVPAGVVGLMLAGLLAAFMSNFAATINAAPAYLVNDIYKRFINPNSSGDDRHLDEPRRVDRRAGWSASGLGLAVTRIMDVMMWITGALYGGYVMANVLKWIWWRFNGYGYFWGMMAGILGAMFIPEFAPVIAPQVFSPQVAAVVISNPIYFVPVLLVLSLVGCLAGHLPEHAGRRGDPQALLPHDAPLGLLGADPRRDPARGPELRAEPRFLERHDQRRSSASSGRPASRRCRSSSCSARGIGPVGRCVLLLVDERVHQVQLVRQAAGGRRGLKSLDSN